MMKNSNDLINKANQTLTTSSENKQSETWQQSKPMDSEQLKRMAHVWKWMTEMFASKWAKQWGPMTENGKPTEHFLTWYEKTLNLTPKQWKCGFDRVERKITADIANDRDPWPPTTPGIFVAMCNPLKSEQVSAAGNAEKSFQEHPYIEEKREERKRLAQPGYKQKQLESGNKALGNLKDMFYVSQKDI